jgi:hypothetical protein
MRPRRRPFGAAGPQFFLKKIGLAQKLNDFGVAKLEVV